MPSKLLRVLSLICAVSLLGTWCETTFGQEFYEEEIESQIRAALEYDFGTQNGSYGWEYEDWGDEWEYEYPGGEIEFEPPGEAANVNPEAGVLRALERENGEWNEQFWGAGYEYEYDGGEIEYNPSVDYYDGYYGGYVDDYDAYYTDDWYEDDAFELYEDDYGYYDWWW